MEEGGRARVTTEEERVCCDGVQQRLRLYTLASPLGDWRAVPPVTGGAPSQSGHAHIGIWYCAQVPNFTVSNWACHRHVLLSAVCYAPSVFVLTHLENTNPDLAGGAHDAPPDSLVGWGGGYPLPIPHPLDAFGVSILGAYGAAQLDASIPCAPLPLLSAPIPIFLATRLIIQMVVVMTSWLRVIDAFLNFKPV